MLHTVHAHKHTIGAMDHLPSNYSPFRQQLEGSWYRSHLNSAWHSSLLYLDVRCYANSVALNCALIGSICRVRQVHTHTIGAMDHLPSNSSPFRQQLEGSWFRSHLNSSAWHTSLQLQVILLQCTGVCVDA